MFGLPAGAGVSEGCLGVPPAPGGGGGQTLLVTGEGTSWEGGL